jgi:non-canonical (house-cleaning) NTP pyrophosphatase
MQTSNRGAAVFGHKKGLEKTLMENGGTVAWATVLDGKDKWSTASGSGFYAPSKVTEHMRLKLRVEPEGETPFEADFSQAFSGSVPFTGWQCKVVYDPADRSRIAVIEGSVAPPGVTHEQAERSATRRAEMSAAVKSGKLAEYVEERKAQALRGELGGTVFVNGQMMSGPVSPQPSVVDQMTKLAALRDRGALTEAEFNAEKAKLLAEG